MNFKSIDGKQCKVSIIAHTKNARNGKELITFQLTYPRFIHAEFMTHRMFSRNASSTRAIPTKKLLTAIRDNPAFFVSVGKNQPGMQANNEVSNEVFQKFSAEWRELANIVSTYSERWSEEYGIHKQVAGRCLEPFSFISVVVTATEWDNWYKLRDHEDAQPEIQDLARTMRKAYEESNPKESYIIESDLGVNINHWHLPYVTETERKTYPISDLLAMSAARCARVSYLTHNKENPNLESDIALYERLVKSEPLHASPLEHQALMASNDANYQSANFIGGWISHRTLLEKQGSIEQLQTYLGKNL